ncbi:MAG: 4a-hydroxytetrahydrobiopterin dehydratase [Patescibacteria group bacterium]
MDLDNRHCVPCEKGMPPLTEAQLHGFLKELRTSWEVVTGKSTGWRIKKEFTFPDFRHSILFINKIAPLAEREGHHPDIYIFYNKVVIELWTHKIGGLSENDFILARKIEKLTLD